MHIIPAIDIIDGDCVRLTRGDYQSKKIYNENPVEVAREFQDNGLERLHLVDLDGARERKVVNLPVLENIVKYTSLRVDFGGGIHSDQDIQAVFDAGATQITAGSIAVRNENQLIEWINQYGAERIILGADVKEGKIVINGWEEESTYNWDDFLTEKMKLGLKDVISTDVARDGMLTGPSFKLYEQILSRFPSINLIASGGISSLVDLKKLKKLGLHGAIIGKAIYESRITLEELNYFGKV